MIQSILDNPELKKKFIDAINYKFCPQITFRGFDLKSVYVFYNEKNDYLEFHSKEKDQFKEFKKFWHSTSIAFLFFNKEKFQTLNYKYSSKGLESIELDFFQGIIFYIKDDKNDEEIINLFGDLTINTMLVIKENID